MAKRVCKTKEQYQAAMAELKQKVQAKLDQLYFECTQEYYDYCLDVLAFSVERAPLDTGDLRGTAYLEINGQMYAHGNDDGTFTALSAAPPLEPVMRARVVFPLPYALDQHEHTEYHHENGMAHYLEIGFDEATREFRRAMIESVWKAR